MMLQAVDKADAGDRSCGLVLSSLFLGMYEEEREGRRDCEEFKAGVLDDKQRKQLAGEQCHSSTDREIRYPPRPF